MTKQDKSLKVLLLKSKYISEEYDSVQELWEKYRTQFYKDFPEEYKKMLENQSNNSPEADNTENDSTENNNTEEVETDKKNPSKISRTLYRRISKITHPDKVKSDFLNNYFKKASSAYSDNDMPTLINIASHLDIDFSDLDLDDIPTEINNDIFNKTMKIANLKGSLAWCWAMATTEEEKEKIKKTIKERFEK
tara:strand:+ start:546 stop:1124 length:579 start_codon:yes stop_codon:yes gene_type:complete